MLELSLSVTVAAVKRTRPWLTKLHLRRLIRVTVTVAGGSGQVREWLLSRAAAAKFSGCPVSVTIAVLRCGAPCRHRCSCVPASVSGQGEG